MEESNLSGWESDKIVVIVLPPEDREGGGVAEIMEQEEEDSNGPSGQRFLSGTCPNPNCRTKLFYLSSSVSVECIKCGQHHSLAAMQNVAEEKIDSVYNSALLALRSIIAGVRPDPGTDNVKVNGLSHYKCKLLSHLLSHYGMDKTTGRATLLTQMGQAELFDCGVLCDRAFRIDQSQLDIVGYGRDRLGSAKYLEGTLIAVRDSNGGEDRLVPIHADPDGHCLVHAISRSLVGQELFWHPLRLNLMQHLETHLTQYKELLTKFVDQDEWQDIINECHPDYDPMNGDPSGLRLIHVFGLANVLRRPIILLDNLEGLQSRAEYSGVFLPVLQKPEECKNKNGELNPPLCIAWNSLARNHFVSLVGIKDKPCPRLPRYMLHNVWGVDQVLLDSYISFDQDGCCSIGGTRMLQENYIQRLVSAMEEVFYERYEVKPDLVAHVYQSIYKPRGVVGLKMEMVRDYTQAAVKERRLLTCLRCGSLTDIPHHDYLRLQKGGQLYQLARRELKELRHDKYYTFKDYEVRCRYDPERDALVPDISQLSCQFCPLDKEFRYIRGDGSVEYSNGDVTSEPAGPNARCHCGFKHYYNGRNYDNRPRELMVPLEWDGKHKVDVVQWWDGESDPALNSNVFQVAQQLVQKHFPGVFGSERLEQKVVKAILNQTAIKEEAEGAQTCKDAAAAGEGPKWNPEESSKIIMSGYQKQSVHKEELGKSEAERQVKRNIECNAPLQQARRSLEGAVKPPTPAAVKASAESPAPVKTTPVKDRIVSSVDVERNSSSSPGPSNIVVSSPTNESGVSTSPVKVVSPGNKKIRIRTANGHSETVTLTEDLTYTGLQSLVFKVTQVPPEQQKLRLGTFPPKVLSPPVLWEDDKVLPLNHGDMINVEKVTGQGERETASPRGRLTNSSYDAHMPDENALLNALAARHSGGDMLDTSLITLGLMAETSGHTMWDLVQNQPHHFSVGGLFYLQAVRDVGLQDGKHITFPSLRDKVFVYNEGLDRLELCVNDYGHYEVGPGVERKAREGGRQAGHHAPHPSPAHPASGTKRKEHHGGSHVTFGSSGIVNKGRHLHRAFEGQGHSLREPDAKMPQEDVALTQVITANARRLHDLCDPQHRADAISEEPEAMDVGEWGARGEEEPPKARLQRIGPGYSVLTPPAADARDRLQLFKDMETAIKRGEGEGEGEVEAKQEEEGSLRQAVDSQPPSTLKEKKSSEQQSETMEATEQS